MTQAAEPMMLGRNEEREVFLLPGLANRHGLITGATGTGKTVSLQVLAERFSDLGVPCVMADVKGDLAGMARAGKSSPKLLERLEKFKLPTPAFQGYPVSLWDVYGKDGHPLRATISDMGPLLLARMLGLNDTQEGVLHLVFKVADDNGLLLLDLKDLRAMLQFVGDNAKTFTTRYGNVSVASIGAALAVMGAAWPLYYSRFGVVLPAALTLLGLMVVWRHKANIARLRAGTENRISWKRGSGKSS